MVNVVLGERERFLDALAGARENDDHRSHAPAVTVVTGVAHDGDDLVDGGWVGGVADALVVGRAAGVVVGHGRRRTAPPSRIEH
jgi:hypothetical protein